LPDKADMERDESRTELGPSTGGGSEGIYIEVDVMELDLLTHEDSTQIERGPYREVLPRESC
jgi:hypothetical protein